ncbi:hypothetical protein KVR01_008715 [Diaporthe batatas]|uniref:uncharacterized protein n=1 Tax=Diaporthe batatas TaxID=748121 RepID=UPI001D05B039|nr:uncharacterized protein KVR01_008715 [Diaporthe batatas]KAG8161728.1 hypothetical protein KVR01_008715 [Diaporthe batatas]
MFQPTTSLLGSLSLALSASAQGFAAAAFLNARQAAPTEIVRQASLENIAVRPNGQLLVTNMNSPNLYAVDPAAKKVSTAVAVSGASGMSGIGEISPDVFVVIGGSPQGTAVHKIDFTGGAAPQATLIKKIPDAKNMNGLAVFDNDTVLLADAGRGNVVRLTVSTGESAVAISDPTMAPSGPVGFGIDGIKYEAATGTVWYTNIFKNSFHKVPVDAAARPAGAVSTLWTNLMGDDLCFGNNGRLYITTNSGANQVVEFDPAGSASAKPVVVAKLSAPTACAAGRGESDKNVVYVTNGQGVYAFTVK